MTKLEKILYTAKATPGAAGTEKEHQMLYKLAGALGLVRDATGPERATHAQL